jgi:nucleotide-binding universal stress UspA family protein
MRIPVKAILAPTDFSEASREATATANDLARAFQAELVIVHVVSTVPPFPGNMGSAAAVFNADTYQSDLIKHWGGELNAFASQLVPGERKVRTIIREGDPGKNIVELAEQEGVDLVVIATHGRTGLKRFVFGSVAEKVVRHCPCPVLVIPEGQQDSTEVE